jgi:hypothetical protein
VDPEVQEELPDWNYSDWRALAEKQRYKELIDLEWRRRQVGGCLSNAFQVREAL